MRLCRAVMLTPISETIIHQRSVFLMDSWAFITPGGWSIYIYIYLFPLCNMPDNLIKSKSVYKDIDLILGRVHYISIIIQHAWNLFPSEHWAISLTESFHAIFLAQITSFIFQMNRLRPGGLLVHALVVINWEDWSETSWGVGPRCRFCDAQWSLLDAAQHCTSSSASPFALL